MKVNIQNAFLKIKADNALIAETEDYLEKELAKRREGQPPSKTKRRFGAFSAGAAVFCLAIGLFSWQIYNTAEAFVSVDVNPSVEFTLNRFDRVIAAHAYNAEGETLLQCVNIYRKKSDNALEILMAEMERSGYITQDGLVSVTVQTASAGREQFLCRTLQTAAEGLLKGYSAQPAIEVFSVTQDVQNHAHDHNMTPARYLAILELMEVDETASLEEYGANSIPQIRQRTQECRQGHGGGDGHGSVNGQVDFGNNNEESPRRGHGHGREHH